jgi:DNA-binding IclR family transcriptional regulator
MFRYVENSSDMSNVLPRLTPSRVPQNLLEHAGDRQFATTLARGMELLRCFSPEQPVLGNKDLSEMMKLPAATVSRLTYTLTCMGYLATAGHYGKYQLGSAVLSLGHPLQSQFTALRRQARPLMLDLADATGGTVAIGIRDRFTVVYIEVARSWSKHIYPIEVGSTLSLAGTAVGRAVLMSCRQSEREALINQLQVKAPEDWRRHGVKLLENIQEFSRQGCCVALGEIYADVQAVAVPLGPIYRGEPAALNFAMQGRAIDEKWLRKEIAPQLQAIARQLT